MDFPLETSDGNFIGGFAVENMDTEGSGSGDIQYVVDDNNEMILGGTSDYSNITDLVLEDGTRAMIVNGTLVTADGQTLILQDGSDLSQYSVDDNTDEIVISKEEQNQFLQIMNPRGAENENQGIIQYVQDDSGDVAFKSENGDQIFYIQDGESNLLPVQAHFLSRDSKQNNQMLEGVEGIIDLEQLLVTPQGALQLESGNFQYAILKDGKLHLQTTSDAMDMLGAPDIDHQANGLLLTQSGVLGASNYLDLTAVKGRNNMKSSNVAIRNKCMNKKLKRDQSNKYEEHFRTNIPPPTTSSSFKNLINKKITIGQTNKGKMLVGKIVNVMKKADVSGINKNQIKRSINLDKSRPLLKKSIPDPNLQFKNLLKIDLTEVGSLVDNESTIIVNEVSNNPENSKNFHQSTVINVCQPPRTITAPSIKNEGNQECKTIVKSKVSSSESAEKPKTKYVKTEHPSAKKDTPKIVNNEESALEQSKIIVHKKVVSKDCFDVITRTLMGLMNMDSVVRKLKNKTIIIKIIEKTYNHEKKDYTRTISYCSGYMVREFKLDDYDGSFSESWRFIPDTNTKDTILGQNNLEMLIQDGSSSQSGLKKFANLTIQITVTSEGNKTTRVIINPPALFQCKACSKSFRTSALLKVHSLDCHAGPLGLGCGDCSLTFKTKDEAKEHSLFFNHSQGRKKGMYECRECNQRFQTPSQLRKHIDLHYNKPCECAICKLSLPNMKELNKHLLTHSDLHLPQLSEAGLLEYEGGNDKGSAQKVFSCHICSRQFSRHSNLQRHIEIHQGEGAMYQCAVCSCSYHYISSLTRHVVSCHMDKAKKFRPNEGDDLTLQDSVSQEQQGLQFFQDDQIVQMIPLEHVTEESLQEYVTKNEIQLLQIPVDSSIVIGSGMGMAGET